MIRIADRYAAPGAWPPVVLAMMLALLLAACLNPNPSCEGLASAFELTLTADSLTPPDPQVCRGSEVTMTISSEVDGVFHIHGYDDLAPAVAVTAGESVEVEFTAARSGQFPIEVHPADNPAGVNVGLFTVHEP